MPDKEEKSMTRRNLRFDGARGNQLFFRRHVVIVGGRSGTLGEFAIAYGEGKLIGVPQGSGGITEEIPGIVTSFGDKDAGTRVVYAADPAQLIGQLAETYTVQHYCRPSCFMC